MLKYFIYINYLHLLIINYLHLWCYLYTHLHKDWPILHKILTLSSNLSISMQGTKQSNILLMYG